jgi:2-dehydropantoate 2-reductase
MTVESAVLGDFVVDVPAAPRLTSPVDVLWVTTKATQLEAAVQLVRPETVATGRVVTLLNGVDHLALLQARYATVVAGAIRVEADRVAPGQIRQSSPFARIELSGTSQDLADQLTGAGIACTVRPDALSLLWEKLVFLAPLALATTAYDVPLGEVRALELFRRCQAETIAVARAQGAAVDVDALERLVSAAPAGMRSSLQKDLERGQPLELDAIAGPVLRGALAHGLPTSATRELVSMVTARV